MEFVDAREDFVMRRSFKSMTCLSAGITTLRKLLETHPNMIRILKFTQNGSMYVQVIMEDATAKGGASDAPRFIFSKNGNLLDWCCETNETFFGAWPNLGAAVPISVEQARALGDGQ